MRNYFIIHGSFGSSQENWFPWLENEIKMRGGEVFNLDFPVGRDKQNYSNWEMVLNSVKRFINKDSVFFCHSISCVFLVKYCIRNKINIGKAIFVSGFNNLLELDEDFDYVNCTMYTTKCAEFKKYCKNRICYYSKSDPYVSLEKLEEFVKLIEAKPICIEGAGHFNQNAGYTKFPQMLDYVK